MKQGPTVRKKGTIIVKIPSTDSPVNLVNKSEKKKIIKWKGVSELSTDWK